MYYTIENTRWHSNLHANLEQQNFLRKIYEIPHTTLVVHDTVTHMIQKSNICWILMTIDSIIADPGILIAK